MPIYLHTAKRPSRDNALVSSWAVVQSKFMGVESVKIVNQSPLSRAGRGMDPTTFLNGFYDWARLNSGQVVELGAGETPRLPERGGVHSYIFEFKRIFTQRLASHLTGIVGNISHLPQAKGPLTRGSCDVVFWHSEMITHLVEYEQLLVPLLSIFEQIISLPEQSRKDIIKGVLDGQGDGLTREEASHFDELRIGPTQFLQRLRGIDTRKSLSGIFSILKSGGYFVETDLCDDVDMLLESFQYVGATFSDVHYIIPEGENVVWAMVLKKA